MSLASHSEPRRGLLLTALVLITHAVALREQGCACGGISAQLSALPRVSEVPAVALHAEHEHLRRRIREFEHTPSDEGPGFLRASARFGHVLRCSTCGLGAQSSVSGPVKIGTAKQLLWDDHVIHSVCNLRRSQGVALFRKVVMRADSEWEGYTFGLYGTVLFEQNVFKMWYRPFENGVAYAESTDGLHWSKIPLGLVPAGIVEHKWTNERPIQIGPQSNILAFGLERTIGEHPAVERAANGGYVAGISCLHDNSQDMWTDVCAAQSDDGLRWETLGELRVPDANRSNWTHPDAIAPGPADSYTQLVPPEQPGGEYTLIARDNLPLWEPNFKWRATRGVRILQGKAGVWREPSRFSLDREYGAPWEHLRWQIYSMTVTKICSGLWLALWNILEWPKDKSGHGGTDVVRIYGGVTRSLTRGFDLDWIYARSPLINTGQAQGFDGGTVLSASQMVTTEDGHWLFYEACTRQHENRFTVGGANTIAAAKFRLDGLWFLSPDKEDRWGSMTTKPLLVEGSELILSADRAEGGSLAVEVLGANGDSIIGMGCSQSVTVQRADGVFCDWENEGVTSRSLESLRGKVVRLRVHAFRAKLYAFQIK